jgi:Uma2 family endonuclease
MIAKRKLSVADFLLMGESGVFAPDERVELLDGEIYTVSPPSSKHTAWVNRIMKALERSIGDRTIIQVQSPVQLSENDAPEPDVAVLAPKADFYETELPGVNDIYLVVEVSLSTLREDRNRKLPSYARAGVPEYWIFNLEERQLEVYREPRNERYRIRLLLGLDEAVTPVAVPGASEIVF